MSTRKILILSDFSEVSTHLLTYGLQLAQYLKAQVWIQYVYYIPPSVAGEVFIPANALDSYEKDISDAFQQLKGTLPELKEKEVHFVVSQGDLIPVMNKLIDNKNIDLVIIGNQVGGFLTNILGSNAIKVIQQAHCPVLSVPDGITFKPFQRMVWATDLKETDKTMLNRLLDFASAFLAHIDAVHVSDKPVDASQLAQSMDLALKNISHLFYHIHATDVEKGLEQHIETHKNDLVVMMPRAHSFFDRIFQKSVSRRVAYQTKIPLLTIHE